MWIVEYVHTTEIVKLGSGGMDQVIRNMDGSWIHIRAEETDGWNGSWITSLARCRLWVTGLLCGARSGKPAAAETARRRAPSGRQDEEIRDQPSRLQTKEKKMSSRYRSLALA